MFRCLAFSGFVYLCPKSVSKRPTLFEIPCPKSQSLREHVEETENITKSLQERVSVVRSEIVVHKSCELNDKPANKQSVKAIKELSVREETRREDDAKILCNNYCTLGQICQNHGSRVIAVETLRINESIARWKLQTIDMPPVIYPSNMSSGDSRFFRYIEKKQ